MGQVFGVKAQVPTLFHRKAALFIRQLRYSLIIDQFNLFGVQKFYKVLSGQPLVEMAQLPVFILGLNFFFRHWGRWPHRKHLFFDHFGLQEPFVA